MSDSKFNRASEAFYDRVEAALQELGLSTNLSRNECKVVDEFAGLDFGAVPCAEYIRQQREQS